MEDSVSPFCVSNHALLPAHSCFSSCLLMIPFFLPYLFCSRSLPFSRSLCSACMLFYRLCSIKVNFIQQCPVKKELCIMDPQISYAADFVRFHSCPHARTCLTGTRLFPATPHTHARSQQSTSPGGGRRCGNPLLFVCKCYVVVRI